MSDLIYFTIGNNIQYYDMWNICFESLIKYGKYKGGYWILLSEDVKSLSEGFNRHNGKIKLLKSHGMLESAANKFRVFEYTDVSKYDRVLYLDCDILVINSIYTILDAIKDGFLVKETCNGTMCHKFLGGDIFNKQEKEKINRDNVKGVNSGIFGFKPTPENLAVLRLAYSVAKNSPPNECLEQPSFNYALYKTGEYIGGLSNMVFNNVDSSLYEPHIPKQNIQRHIANGVVALHFCGGPGNYKMKYGQMKKVMELI